MLFRDVVQLVAIQRGEDEWGDPVEQETKREVYANKKGVKQSEFYAAALAGLRPEAVFEVRVAEYAGELMLEHEGRRYDIIRTFDKNGETMELVCQWVRP